MNKKALAILMRARMRPNNSINPTLSSLTKDMNQMKQNSPDGQSSGRAIRCDSDEGSEMRANEAGNCEREVELVRTSMHSAISMSKTEDLDTVFNNFSEGYANLSIENRRKLLLVLAREYDLNRVHVRELIKQYLGLELPSVSVDKAQGSFSEEGLFSSFYRVERNLRHALRPLYEVLFDRLNTHPGGLRFLSILRSDILSILTEENISSLRALDSYLKEKLSTWLSPAALELHQITWDDPASLLEKIVAYEAVHPISNLLDLKRRLGVGRRCFGYLHPAIPGEPLIFIEVALLKNIAQTIQEVLWDSPPIPENEATCALFYSISSTQMKYVGFSNYPIHGICSPKEKRYWVFQILTIGFHIPEWTNPEILQPGLSGINLGKFLIKRVITLVKREMPYIFTFATLSPIPGFMQWLLSKLASQTKLAESDMSHSPAEGSSSTFWENILKPEEEKTLMSISKDITSGKNGMEVMLNLLTATDHKWTNSPELLSVLEPLLMRLCARYLLQEKKRGKALDSVANFHLQNGAMIERINWMADRSEKGLAQSGGIMVNYVYRLEHIDEFAHSYLSSGDIHASSDLRCTVEPRERWSDEKF